MQLVLTSIPLEELLTRIKEVVKQQILSKENSNLEEKLLSPGETCKLFQPTISKVTLSKWTKDGHLIDHRLGGRVFYKYGEVMAAAKTLKRYKRVQN